MALRVPGSCISPWGSTKPSGEGGHKIVSSLVPLKNNVQNHGDKREELTHSMQMYDVGR